MKALKYIAGICLALSLTSCDDFLTKTSPDELTSGNYWRNKSDAESGMAAVYSHMYFLYLLLVVLLSWHQLCQPGND